MDLFDEIYDIEPLPFSLPHENGYMVTWNENLNGFDIKIPNGELFYSPKFFEKKISDRCVAYFLENDRLDIRETKWKELSLEEFENINFKNIKWKQDFINLYGRKPLPRLTSWYGDEGKSYSYSGIKSIPNNWNDGLIYLKEKIEEITKIKFNSVLLNWYRDGDDYMNWHADDEAELGSNPIIASVNFGETRDFVLRNNADNSMKIKIPLAHGTLLIMKEGVQHYWQHSVPKRKNINKSRFKLTFRVIKN